MTTHVPVSRMIDLCSKGEDILTKDELFHFAECGPCRNSLRDVMAKCAETEAVNGIAVMNGSDLGLEQQKLVVIAEATVREAERLIESCEGCNPEGAEIPFDWILDRVTGSNPSVTDYILEAPAKCPNCQGPIFEKNLIEPTD